MAAARYKSRVDQLRSGEAVRGDLVEGLLRGSLRRVRAGTYALDRAFCGVDRRQHVRLAQALQTSLYPACIGDLGNAADLHETFLATGRNRARGPILPLLFANGLEIGRTPV